MRHAPCRLGFRREKKQTPKQRRQPLELGQTPAQRRGRGAGGRCLLVTRDRNLLVLNGDLFKVTKLPSPGSSPAFGQDSPSDSRVSAALAVIPSAPCAEPGLPAAPGLPGCLPRLLPRGPAAQGLFLPSNQGPAACLSAHLGRWSTLGVVSGRRRGNSVHLCHREEGVVKD